MITQSEVHELPFTLGGLQTYLSNVIGDEIEVQQVQRLARGKELKEYGYGKPLLIEYMAGGQLATSGCTTYCRPE